MNGASYAGEALLSKNLWLKCRSQRPERRCKKAADARPARPDTTTIMMQVTSMPNKVNTTNPCAV